MESRGTLKKALAIIRMPTAAFNRRSFLLRKTVLVLGVNCLSN